MSASEYQRRVQLLNDQKCPACRGLGKCDDAEPGDIAYNEWACTSCGGSGLTQPAQVDVEMVREVIASLYAPGHPAMTAAANKLTAALQEKGNG